MRINHRRSASKLLVRNKKSRPKRIWATTQKVKSGLI